MKNNFYKKLDFLIPNPKCALDYQKDYELLIAVMLSAQTTDARVNIVTKELFKYDLENLADMELSEIEQIIKSLGTYHRKAIYVKQIAEALIKDHKGVVPHNRDYIEKLPGVGHKTCNVVFAELFNEPTMPVDTHINRVSKRLGLAKEKDSITIIEKKLMKFFDKDKWNRIHLQLVLFGRHFCTAKTPKCEACPFKNNECTYKKR